MRLHVIASLDIHFGGEVTQRSGTALQEAVELIAQARRELWWFIETYADKDDDTVARAMSIQDDLLYPAIKKIEAA